MSRRAARLLARGWYKGARRWWRASAGVLALVLVAVLLVAGLFAGLQGETSRRVGDLYTESWRVTKEKPGAAPAAVWEGNATADALATLQAAAGPGGRATPRLESQFILSRRSLVDAYLEENEQYEVGAPGRERESPGSYSVGVLLGLPAGDAGVAARLRPYLVRGVLPAPNPDHVELLMSVPHFRSHLSPQERGNLSAWPPRASELGAFRFEVTAARVDNTGFFKDVIRRPAVVVGLFETGLDAVDSFTLVTNTDAVRDLLGYPPGAVVANAFTVTTEHAGLVAAATAAQGWAGEDEAGFAGRYLGQLLAVVRALALLFTSMFFGLPVFLLWHGLQQILDRQRREVAVCSAIGVPRSALRGALARLTLRVVLLGLLSAALVVVPLAFWLPAVLPGLDLLPLPVSFTVPPLAVAGVAALTVGSAALALTLALRRNRRERLVDVLRSP